MVVANSNDRTRLAVNAADYDFTFRIDDESEIKVYLVNTVDGEEVLTLQTLTTNYTVTIDTVNEGGTVSFQESDGEGGYDPVTPDCDEVLMVRNVAFTQAADIPVRGGFRETVIELALDKLEMQIQQLKGAIDYSADSDPVSVASAAASAAAAAASETAAETAQAAAEVAQAAAEEAAADAEAAGVDAVNNALDTVTGHDHDGSDSKKVVATDLDLTGITDGHVLYNNAGTLAGKSFDSLNEVFSAGSILVASSDASSAQTASDSYVKLKEIQVPWGGTLTVKFTLNPYEANLVSGRIYVNGVARGTERTVSTPTEFSENITIVRGDLLQIYGKKDVGSGNKCSVTNFRLYALYPILFITNTA